MLGLAPVWPWQWLISCGKRRIRYVKIQSAFFPTASAVVGESFSCFSILAVFVFIPTAQKGSFSVAARSEIYTNFANLILIMLCVYSHCNGVRFMWDVSLRHTCLFGLLGHMSVIQPPRRSSFYPGGLGLAINYIVPHSFECAPCVATFATQIWAD